MEENKTVETPVEEQISKEQAMAQVQTIMKQANERTQQIIEQARQLEQMLRDKTVENLFRVLKHAVHFEPEFVEKCAKAISTYLSNMIETPEEETATKEKE